MGDSTDFTIDIDAPPEKVLAGASAIDRLTNALTLSKAEATAMASAVSKAESAYNRAESAADKAARAVEKGSVAIEETRSKWLSLQNAGDFPAAERAAKQLDRLESKQGGLVAKANAAAAALEREGAALDKLNAKADAGDKAHKNLTKQLEATKAKTAALSAAAGSGKANEIAEGLGKLGGPLGSVGQKVFGVAEAFKKMGASLGSAGPYVAVGVALVAIAAGAIAVAAAAAAGLATIGAWAVSLGDAARTQKLLAAGVAGSVAVGAELNATLDLLANRTVPLSRDELLGMASNLKKAGFEGRSLSVELEKAAFKAAAAKFGPDFEQQLTSLPVMADRLKANISTMFGGLRIEKLLSALGRVVDQFDKTGASGKAIRVVFESLFQPLIDGAVSWIPKMVGAFIQFEIMVLKALIAIKPFGSTILEVGKYLGALALIAGGVLAVALGIVVTSLTVAAAGITVFLGLVGALILGLGYVVSKIFEFGASILSGIVNAFNAVTSYLGSVSLSQMGTDLIMGLVSGISGSAGAVLAAMTGVVDGAIGAAKSALGIASPSKVFAEIGGYTAEGMAGGVDEGAGQVQGSLESMVAPPEAAGPAAPAAGAQVASGSAGGNIFYVTVTGGGSAKENVDAFADWFLSIGARAGAAVT